MKHAASRELYAYWEERRGERPAPERADIEPGAIRAVLSDTFILELDGANGHSFRLAGTRVCALFGRELKGESFIGLWAAASQPVLRDLLAVLNDERVGTVAGVTALSEMTGRTLWVWYVNAQVNPGGGGSVWGAIASDGNRLIFGTGNTCGTARYTTADGEVALDLNGKVLWSFVADPQSSDDYDTGSSTVISNGVAMFKNKDGILYALDAGTGRALFTRAQSLPTAIAYAVWTVIAAALSVPVAVLQLDRLQLDRV